MQNHGSVQQEIEYLLVELSSCVNDLHSFRRQLSIDDTKQAEISLQKLNALITCVSNQSNPLKLVS